MAVIKEIFEFEFGGTTRRYTNYTEDIVYESNTYYSAPIVRGSIKNNTKTIDSELTMPYDLIPEIEDIVIRNFKSTIWVTIKRIMEDGTAYVLFYGVMSSFFYDSKYSVNIKLDGFSTLVKAQIPTGLYQPVCRWELFSTECGLDKESFGTTLVYGTDALWVDGNHFQSGDLDTTTDYYLNGTISINGGDEQLFITKTSYDGFDVHIWTLNEPYTEIVTGTSLRFYMGCDKNVTSCYGPPRDNYDNFGGCPFIPSKNPFVGRLA